jgi:hypothetical protein
MSEMSGYDQGIREVRRWKSEVSARIENLGFAEFNRQAAKETVAFVAEIEKLRLAKLSKGRV